MNQRCRDKKCNSYPNYGGRGIKICQRWGSFENFFADMGARPSPRHSLDRIDNAGNYEPPNCRWATTKQQAKNKRKQFSSFQIEPLIDCLKDYRRRCRCTLENSIPGSLPMCLICQNTDKALKGLNK
jgi:hypothetical protein